MGLYYNERQALALALWRHVMHAKKPDGIPMYTNNEKFHLKQVIDTFRDYGYSKLTYESDREAFDELFRQATD